MLITSLSSENTESYQNSFARREALKMANFFVFAPQCSYLLYFVARNIEIISFLRTLKLIRVWIPQS